MSLFTDANMISIIQRLKPEDSTDPNVMDVWVKGSGRYGESNIAGLRRYNLVPKDDPRTEKDLVIMEHKDWAFDRRRHAFCILNYSATLNGMLLQWMLEASANMFQ
jgi:hypothetical protein